MALERLELLITASAKGAVAGIKETEAATTSLDAKAGGLGKTLNILGIGSGQLSGALRVGVAASAVVAGAAVAKFAVDGIEKFASLTGEVRGYQRVLGGTAEDNSRLAASMRVVGIDSDTATKGLFQLTKRIGEGKDTLANWGVEVAHSSDGNVNMFKTLTNVADAYQSIQDPSQKAAFLAENFGRQGQTLIPILSKTKEELQGYAAEADKSHQIFSQDDLDRGREYQVAMRQLHEATQGLAISLGATLLPTVTMVTTALTDVIHTLDALGKSVGVANLSIIALGATLASTGSPWGIAIGAGIALTGVLRDIAPNADNTQKKLADTVATLSTVSTGKAVAEFQNYANAVRDASGDTLWEGVRRIFSLDFSGHSAEVSKGTAAWQAFHDVANQSPAAAQKIIDGMQRQGDATGPLQNALDRIIAKKQAEQQATNDQSTANEQLVQTYRDVESITLALSGTEIGRQQALLNLQQAQHGVDAATFAQQQAAENLYKVYHDGKSTEDDKTQAQLQLTSANDSLTAANLRVQQATQDVEVATLKAKDAQDAYGAQTTANIPAIDTEIARLIDTKNKFGDATGAIQDQINKLEDHKNHILGIPTVWETDLRANSDQARATLDELMRQYEHWRDVSGRPITLGEVISASGGYYLPQGQHGGPIPGGVNDPYPMIAHGGEYLLSADVVQRIKSGRPSRGAMAGGDTYGLGGGGGTTNYYAIQLPIGTPSADAGRAVVDAIAAYERASGSSWRN